MKVDEFGAILAEMVAQLGGECITEDYLGIDKDDHLIRRCKLTGIELEVHESVNNPYMSISPYDSTVVTIYDMYRMDAPIIESGNLKLSFGRNDIIIDSDGVCETSIFL